MGNLLRVFRREAGSYFASPVAYLFIGTFLAVTLFIFFWAESFFARNIADVRPLFEWMPLLLIALVATLTMRAWSEELRSGTVEVLMTAPVSSLALAGGKFLAALSLVAIALALTLPLPITADILGPLDWGPVIGGYVASLFLAAAYVAMGLFVSSRTDNQIISLMVTALLGGAFYVIGSDWLTALAPAGLAEVMRLLGTGSRFDELTRGVLDLRDVYYYMSLVGLFLALNVYSLEKLRWGGDQRGARHHVAWRTAVALVAVNFLAANLWLQPIAQARADITAGNRYTLSPATDLTLSNLAEPLLIRGYFSSNTHPLIAPLVPRMRDLLTEYGVMGGDDVHVQFVDPQADEAAAREAQRAYGIEPIPLQTASRYQSSVVSAYFHVLVKYGDQTQVLSLQDLVEIKGSSASDIRVALRSPEYELTSAIREVARKWRGGVDVFSVLEEPVTFHGYVSPAELLPDALDQARENLRAVVEEMQSISEGRFKVEFAQPRAGDGALARRLESEYGFRPMTTSLLGDQSFYFHMVLQQGDQTVPVELPESFAKADLRQALEAGLQRFGKGLPKTVAVYQPSAGVPRAMRRQLPGGGGPSYTRLLQRLRENAAVTRTDLSDGRVPAEADLLLVLSPGSLDEKQRFAIDQFLMRGGTVVIAGSPMQVQVSRRTGVQVSEVDTGLANWLAGYGVDVGNSLVLDPQSGALTLPRRSATGGVRLQTVSYPYFLDIRGDGLASVPMLEGMRQLTMAWASPVTVDAGTAGDLQVTPLIESSDQAWTSTSTDVMPDLQRYPRLGFEAPEERARQTLAVMLEGRFQSAFKGRESPMLRSQAAASESRDPADTSGEESDAQGTAAGNGGDRPDAPVVASVIEHSPASSRLVVLGGGNFVSDSALRIAGQSFGTQYLRPVELVQNVVDWSLEDPALLAIRGQSHYSRLLRPVADTTRVALESANYATALGGLLLLFAGQRVAARRRQHRFQRILSGEDD